MTLADAANLHTFVDAVRFIGDHPSFLAHKALEQLELSGAALGIALLIALPLGIALGHFHRGSTIAIGTSIVGRALPSLVLIAAFLTILGIGFFNNMVALAVLATGPILTNSFDGVTIDSVDAVERVREDRPGGEHGEGDHVVDEADPEHRQERGDQNEARQRTADDRRGDRDPGATVEMAEQHAERQRDADRDPERRA